MTRGVSIPRALPHDTEMPPDPRHQSLGSGALKCWCSILACWHTYAFCLPALHQDGGGDGSTQAQMPVSHVSYTCVLATYVYSAACSHVGSLNISTTHFIIYADSVCVGVNNTCIFITWVYLFRCHCMCRCTLDVFFMRLYSMYVCHACVLHVYITCSQHIHY